jgi:colicin import membrane protein
MKKTHIYFLFPIIAILAFAAYDWHFSAGYEQAQAQKAEAAREARLARLQQENDLRLKAVHDAEADQKRQAAERAAKKALEQKRTDDKDAAEEARNKARADLTRLKERAKGLERDVKAEQDDIDKITAETSVLKAEQGVLGDSLKLAEDNTKSLTETMEHIDAAEAAAAEAAARAAAAAAKKSSS